MTASTIKPCVDIDKLSLSVRAHNGLRRGGIHTVDQLTEHSEADLLDIRSFGATLLDEVKRKLAALGLSLREEVRVEKGKLARPRRASPLPPKSKPVPKSEIGSKTHEKEMRRMAERRGLVLVKSPRRSPQARGHGTYMLIQEGLQSPKAIERLNRKMDRGEGLTLAEVEQVLGRYTEGDLGLP